MEQARMKVMSPSDILQVHLNPLNLERNSESSNVQKVRTMGFQEMLQDLRDDIVNYYTADETDQPDFPYLAIIKGEIGSGKTAFARNLIDDLHSSSEFNSYLNSNKGKLPVFASNINAETFMHFLNAWQPILQMMMVFFCKRIHSKKETFMADFITRREIYEMTDVLCELFAVDKASMLQKRGG